MLDSISDQIQKPDKVILVDDLHSAETSELLRNFQLETAMNCELLVNLKNCGISISTKNAIDLADTEFVAFLDADDLLDPYAVARAKKVITKNAIYSSIYETFQERQTQQNRKFERERTFKSMYLSYGEWQEAQLFENIFSPFKVIPTSVAKKFNWEKSKDGVQDWLLNYTIPLESNVHFDNVVSYRYRVHANQTSNQLISNDIALARLNSGRISWRKKLNFNIREIENFPPKNLLVTLTNAIAELEITTFFEVDKFGNFILFNFDKTRENFDYTSFIGVHLSNNFDEYFFRRAVLWILKCCGVPLGLIISKGNYQDINFFRQFSGIFDFAIFQSQVDLMQNKKAFPQEIKLLSLD